MKTLVTELVDRLNTSCKGLIGTKVNSASMLHRNISVCIAGLMEEEGMILSTWRMGIPMKDNQYIIDCELFRYSWDIEQDKRYNTTRGRVTNVIFWANAGYQDGDTVEIFANRARIMNLKAKKTEYNAWIEQKNTEISKIEQWSAAAQKEIEQLEWQLKSPEPVLLLDGNRGIYQGQQFACQYRHLLKNKEELKEALDGLQNGPDNENYLDSLDHVENNAVLILDGKRFTVGRLPDSDDLWAIPEGYEYPE